MNEDKFCIDELASIRAFCINSDKEDIYKYIYSLQQIIDKAYQILDDIDEYMIPEQWLKLDKAKKILKGDSNE